MPKTPDDVFSDEELAAIEDAQETKREYEQRQEAFLESVASESETEVLETQTELVDDVVVDLEAKLNGELIDKLSHVQERLENAEQEERLYDVSDAADDAAQLLADVTVDPAYDKETFYQVYQAQGLEDMAKLLSRAFEALIKERERLSGDAQGFRKQT